MQATPADPANPTSQPATEVLVGRRLRDLRTKRGFSLRVLADRSGLNVNTLSLVENGKSSPSVSTLQQLATALEVPIMAFFSRNWLKSELFSRQPINVHRPLSAAPECKIWAKIWRATPFSLLWSLCSLAWAAASA